MRSVTFMSNLQVSRNLARVYELIGHIWKLCLPIIKGDRSNRLSVYVALLSLLREIYTFNVFGKTLSCYRSCDIQLCQDSTNNQITLYNTQQRPFFLKCI